jgi:hypothetical protein
MTVKEAYIYIQQGVQAIASFAYANVQLQELDYNWNYCTDLFIQLAFPDKYAVQKPEKYQDVQASIDDLKILEVLGNTNTLLTTTIGSYPVSYITLPENYRHLLNDSTLVKPLNCDTTREVPNRLTETEDIKTILENSIFKTSQESPISHLSGNNLYVYNFYKNTKQFDIEAIYMDYLAKPTKVDFGNNGSTVLQFPDQTCFKIIKTAIIYMSIIAEQNPNKIQLLKQ